MLNKSRFPQVLHLLLMLCMAASLLIGNAAFPTPVQALASSITVTSKFDNTTRDGKCTLREAINNANGTAPDEMNPDCGTGLGYTTIRFDDSLNTATIQMSSTLWELTSADGLTIDGGGDMTLKGSTRIVLTNYANLTLKDLTITNTANTAVYNWGGTLTVTGSTFRDNQAGNANGGAIRNDGGTVIVNNSTFSNNSAGSGGGIYNNGYSNGGSLTITNSTFSSNSAGSGGGIYSDWGIVSIMGSTFSNNSATSNGGGIFARNRSLSITVSTFSGNLASDAGGGIYNSWVSLSATSSIFNGNSAGLNGGGGIFNALGSVDVRLSAFSGNSGTYPGGGYAGGIRNWLGTLTVTNSTFANNSGYSAGGIASYGGSLTVTNSTFSGNVANTSWTAGGINVQNSTESTTLNLYNTIIANSMGADCLITSSGTNFNSSNNLIEDTGVNACRLTNGVNGNVTGVNPGLSAMYGSPGYFLAFHDTPAVEGGNDAICAAAPVNNQSQNGVTRPSGAHCSIGSAEGYWWPQVP